MAAPTTPSETPENFLIELIIDGAPQYMLCGRIDGPHPADEINGLCKADVEKLFARDTLRAAIVPRLKPIVKLSFAAQSMD